jgi:glycosyltransferase involved in cell wall biosynthesis
MRLAARTRLGPTDLVVVHVGDSPESDAGGISRVIKNHLSREFRDVSASYLTSYDPRRNSWIGRQTPTPAGLVRLLRFGSMRTRPAVLHVHMSARLSLVREGAFALVGRLLGWKVCVTWHASSGLSERGRAGRLALQVALAPAHVVHVLSETHASAVPIAGKRIVVIPNDVPIPTVIPSMEARGATVVFAGEFGHRKGADLLLSAWQRLDQQLKDEWTLEVFGRVAPAMVTILEHFDDDSVRVHGLTDGSVVGRALMSSSIAVLPSRAEGLPMFVLEAMAAGCAVVATDVGAIRPLIGDAAGLLVEAGNVPALASALNALMTSPALRARFGEAARARILNDYAEQDMTTRWRALYWELVS